MMFLKYHMEQNVVWDSTKKLTFNLATLYNVLLRQMLFKHLIGNFNMRHCNDNSECAITQINYVVTNKPLPDRLHRCLFDKHIN